MILMDEVVWCAILEEFKVEERKKFVVKNFTTGFPGTADNFCDRKSMIFMIHLFECFDYLQRHVRKQSKCFKIVLRVALKGRSLNNCD